MLNTVDPNGRGELSYLEFYNCCYSSIYSYLPWSSHNNIMDPIGQNLQVTK